MELLDEEGLGDRPTSPVSIWGVPRVGDRILIPNIHTAEVAIAETLDAHGWDVIEWEL